MAALRPRPPSDLEAIDALLALHLLVLTPLLLALRPPRGATWLRPAWLLAAALTAGSAWAPGGARPALALTWVALAAGLLLEAAGALRRAARQRPVWRCEAEGLRAVAALFLLVGAGWIVVSRAGWPLPGLEPEKVLLAAIHGHATGFGGLSLMAALARDAGPGERRALLAAGVLLGVGFGLTGVGIAFAPALEPAGAGTLLLALGTWAGLALPRALAARGLPRLLALLGLLGLLLGLALGLTWSLRLLEPGALARADMIRAHGTGLGLGFVLCGAAGLLAVEAARRATAATEAPLLLYDGACGLCDRTVQWILAHDRRRTIRFAPLQGSTAGPLLQAHGLAPGPGEDFDSIVLVGPRGRTRTRSQAAFALLVHMGGPWRPLGHVGAVVPRPLADAAYRLVARHRKQLFPPPEVCRVPRPGERARFLP